MAVQEKLYTIADLEKLADDDRRYELVKGVLVTMPPPKPEHGLVTARMTYLLTGYALEHELGAVLTECGYHLSEDPDTVRAPDISFIAKGRVLPTDEYAKMAPDLAVEVASPGNSAEDLNDKVEQYFGAGVRLVWLVYPKTRKIYAYRSVKDITVLDVDDTLDGGDVLPGFQLPVRDLFAQVRE